MLRADPRLRPAPRRVSSTRKPRGLPAFRPVLEALEDRETPAAVSWDGGGDGVNWTHAPNWSGDVLPGAADDVTINAAGTVQYAAFAASTVNSLTSTGPLTVSGFGGSLTVAGPAQVSSTLTVSNGTLTLGGPTTVQDLTQTGGTINGAGDLTIDGKWSWSGSGTMAGTGRTILNGTAALGGGFFSKLDGRVVDSHGTAGIPVGDSLTFTNNAVWNNRAGSTFTIQDSSSLSGFFPGAAAFNNEGTFRRSGPLGTAAVGIAFNNTGVVDVQTGTLSLNGGGTGSGTFTLAPTTTLTIGSGTYNLAGGATVSGGGVLQVPSFAGLVVGGPVSVDRLTVSGGTVTANAPLTVQSLLMANTFGTITGPGTVTVSGDLTWNQGIMTGTGVTNLNGTSTLAGGFFSKIDGRIVNNAGTATVLAGQTFTFANAAVWNNLPGSTFLLPDSAGVGNFFANASAFNNAGLVRKTAPPGTATIAVPFHNSGTTEVQVGVLALTGGGTSTGTFTLDAGTTLRIGGTYTLNGGSATGAGVVEVPSFTSLVVAGEASIAKLAVSGGTVTANAPLTVQSLLMANTFGTITGPGTVTVSGDLTWNQGIMTGTGVTNLNGTATLAGGFFSKLDGRTVNNAGTATVALANSFTFAGKGVWNNLPGSTFLLPDSARLDTFFPAGAAFNNAGTLRNDGPPGIAIVAVPVTNTGVVETRLGRLHLTGGYVQTAGRTTVTSGATLFVPGLAGVQILGGELTGTGTVEGAVTSGGTVRTGSSPGILTIFGSYTQTASGVLDVEIGGLTPGSGHDRLFVTGPTTLGGTLAVRAVNGFLPDFGDKFDVVLPGPRIGEFAAYSGLDLGTYRLLVPEYGPNFVRLVTVSSNKAPVLDPIADQTVDEGSLLSFTAAATGPEPSETITYSLDLGAPAGATIDPATGVFTFTPADGPATYTVTVRATDNGLPALSSTRTVTITVNNVAPTASLTGPAAGVRGQPLSYAGAFTDPGTADTHTLDWVVTRDGLPYAAGTGPGFTFVPTESGTYAVALTVTDDDGGIGTSTQTVTVTAMGVQADPLNPGKTLLVIGGTTGADFITVAPGLFGSYVAIVFTPGAGELTVGLLCPAASGWELTLTVGGFTVTAFTASLPGPLSGVVAYAQAGDDDVQMAGWLSPTAWLHGGDGDDRLKGGGGPDVLLGEAGADLLVGGSGRDLLIGGRGADRIVGNSDDDILIAGVTAYDADRGALALLHGTWVRDDLGYEERIASLQDATQRGGVHLGRETAFNDLDADVLTGTSGLDWFWFDATRDRVTDLHDEAFQNDLDFIEP